MSSSNSSQQAAFPTATILTIVFVVLRLTGCIAWPWVWVLSPLWIGAAFALVVIAVVVTVAIAAARRPSLSRALRTRGVV